MKWHRGIRYLQVYASNAYIQFCKDSVDYSVLYLFQECKIWKGIRKQIIITSDLRAAAINRVSNDSPTLCPVHTVTCHLATSWWRGLAPCPVSYAITVQNSLPRILRLRQSGFVAFIINVQEQIGNKSTPSPNSVCYTNIPFARIFVYLFYYTQSA